MNDISKPWNIARKIVILQTDCIFVFYNYFPFNSFGLSKDQGTFALPTFGTSGTNVEINRRGDFSGINFPDKVENR